MQTAAKGAGGVVNELVGDVLRFPVWWYTTGVVHTAASLAKSAHYYARTLAILVWIRNVFVPMFGQYDWQGRIISVFMRTVQIVFRSLAFGVYCLMLAAVFVVYLALPLVSGAFVLYHLTGGVFGVYG